MERNCVTVTLCISSLFVEMSCARFGDVKPSECVSAARIASAGCWLLLLTSRRGMVCLFVTTTNPAKAAEPIEMPVWRADSHWYTKNHVQDGSPDPLAGRGTYGGACPQPQIENSLPGRLKFSKIHEF